MRITDEALVAAAELSDRYITDRFLPDKAIDLIDQAGCPGAAARKDQARRTGGRGGAAGGAASASRDQAVAGRGLRARPTG